MSVFVSPPGLRGRDPFSKLLLTGDALADASNYARAVTNAGAGVTIAAPTGDGLPSGFPKALNFSSAYLYLSDNADFHLAADAATDFTIDAWCKGSGCLCSLFDGTNGWAVILYGNSYGLTFSHGNALATNIVSNDTPNTTVWNHCAVVRRNGTLFIYRNGILKASGTLGAVTLPSVVFRVGAYSWSGSYSYFSGQMANLRVTKGLARWTRDFTPPARLY